MGEKRGMKALEAWCKKVTDGYRGVKIDNMTTCWRDGLAFCAIIHHFRPDLIDFDNLEKDDIYHNNELAFRTAEHHLGIPALLDAEDMVEFEVPDRLSILTYLSQFYQTLTGRQQGSSPARVLSKRPLSTEEGVLSPVSQSPPSKIAAGSRRREPCAKCGLPVFIAERLLVSGRTLYHRTCFRCARCQHQLSLANFYETEGGEYCCETCPDEVLDSSNLEDKYKVASQREESNLDMIGHAGPQDEYSAEFELTLEKLKVPCISEVKEQPEIKRSKLRSDFMISQLNLPELQDDKELSSVGGKEKTLPKPEQQSIGNNKDNVCSLISRYSALEGQNIDHTSYSALNTSSLNNVYEIQDKVTTKGSFVNIDNTPSYDRKCNIVAKHFSTKSDISSTVGDSLFSGSSVPLKVISHSPNCVGGGNQLKAINNSVHDKDLNSFGDTSSSIVKSRRKLFENSGNMEENTKASKISSSKKSAVYWKDETNSAPLDLPNTGDGSVEPADGKLLVETNKVEVQENQDGQEKSVAALDISKEKSEDETLQTMEIVGLPLKDDSEPHIGDAVQGIDSKDRMTNITVSGLSSTQEISKNDILKDTSSIKVGEMLQTMEIVGLTLKDDSEPHIGDAVQGIDSKDRMADLTVSGLSGMQELDKIDILKDTSSIKVGEMLQTVEIVGLPLKNDSEPCIGDAVQGIESKDRMANITVSGLSGMQELDKNDVLKDTSPIKVLESGDFQTSSASSKSATARKNSDCTYPSELNPFGDDDGDTEQTNKESVVYKPSERKVAKEMNPFGSTDDEAEMQITMESPTPLVVVTRGRMKKVLEAPKINLNPFWSDGEEPSSEDENVDSSCSKSEKLPVPRPRTVISVTPEPRPLPRKSLMTDSSDKFGSASSLSSLSSAGGSSSRKKKKPAPAPPRAQDLFPETLTAPSDNSSEASSPCPSLGYSLSPVATSRHRKSRPAPPPPTAMQGTAALSFSEAKLVVEKFEDSHFHISEGEHEKNKKDVTNRNRQSQTSNDISFSEQQLILGPNKSTFGQWKRKKGPAPPRPVPQRRQIKAIPMKEVKRELDDIEVQQQELERQGVTLEKTIRDKFDQTVNVNDDTTMPPDVEELVLQLFELVNEKNELFRRQAELMYLRRQQRLEEEHADLEYQIRCLMDVPEHTKTDSDKAREEELIQSLVEIVERRNEVVECLEMDRIREAEEDRSIRSRLGMLSKGKILCKEEVTVSCSYSGKLKKNKRDKEKHSNKKAVKSEIDVDKDVDEREESLPKHTKEKKSKRKWF